MNSMKVLLVILISYNIVYADTYEEDLLQDLVELQRRYSGNAIFEMIRYALTNEKECNVTFSSSKESGVFTVLVGKKHNFSFNNNVESGETRDLSTYNCLLSKDKKRLECERVLPNEEMNQSWSDYIRMTMNLDEKGNIVSMHGKKTREHRKLGFSHPWFNQVLANFKCDIAHPSKVDKPEVKDEEKRQGKTGIDGKKEPDTVKRTKVPEKIKNR